MRKKTVQIIVIKECQEKIRFEPCSHHSRMYTSKKLFRDATRRPAFFLSSFLSFLLLHCFPPLLCIQVACPPVTLGAQSLVTVVVFPGLDRFRMKSDFTTRIEKYFAMFYAGCPSYRNHPHLSGLETGTKAALI